MPAAREHDDDESGCNTRKMMIHARQMTRLGQMFWNVAIVVKRAKTWGRKNEAERKAMEDSASDDEKHIFALVKLLAVLEPDVITELARTGRGSRTLAELVEHQLSKGQSNAKAEDMRKVRLLLCTWRTWATRPDAENPSTRGLHNPETAFLLTSLDLDWDDLDVRRKFMNGEILISELDFPRFCYPQGKGDKDKPWLNAFCGELLIRGARAIVLSPAASKNNPITATAGSSSGGRRRAAKSRGLTGLAKRYDMAEVAPPLIAYVTVVVRHALTSDEDYSDDGSGFDYELFYNEIREHLEDPRHAAVTAKIIKFWNDEIFGHYKRRKTAAQGRAERGGTRARLDAALDAGLDLGLDDTGEAGADGN